jgi:putative ABC transport system substrate-binding protein
VWNGAHNRTINLTAASLRSAAAGYRERSVSEGSAVSNRPTAVRAVQSAGAARIYGRRRLLQGAMAAAGVSLLSRREAAGQPAAGIPRIGFLAVGPREGLRTLFLEGLLQGLREHGYVEGQNIFIEYRFSGDRDDRLPALAAELVALKVRLIVVSGTPATFAAKKATSTIPLVMGGLAANPVDTGLVASLGRPGGNITGMTLMTSQLGGKRLELLKAIVPGLSLVAVVWNPLNPTYGPVLKALEEAAPTAGVKLQRVEVRAPADFEDAFKAATRQRAGGLLVPGDPLTANRFKMIADLALKYRLPTAADGKDFVQDGGLLSLGPDIVDLYRRAATHVDKILKGARAADLPMEQPTKFELAVNMKTAQALGLTVPQSILIQTTHVIQ